MPSTKATQLLGLKVSVGPFGSLLSQLRPVTERWVVHLPVVVGDLLAAQRIARVVAHWTHVLPQADPAGTTVSAEDDQNVRHCLFCDRRLASGLRCLLWLDHDGECLRRPRWR